jgi:hypothetical protein
MCVYIYYHNSIVITLFIIITNQNNLLLPMGIKKFKGFTRQEFSILYKFIDNKTYSIKKIKTNTQVILPVPLYIYIY